MVTTAGTVPVGALTDAELAVLSRAGTLPMTPAWSRLSPPEQQVARDSASRSLVSRGLFDPRVAGRDGVRRDLRSVLTLREAAGAAVAATRTTASGRDHWYAHVVDDVVLLEEVSDDGLHRFALATAGALADLVAGAVLQPDADRPAAASADDQREWLRADVLTCRAGVAPHRWSVVSGPGGCWRLKGDRSGEDATPLGPEQARSLVAGQLARLAGAAVRVR